MSVCAQPDVARAGHVHGVPSGQVTEPLPDPTLVLLSGGSLGVLVANTVLRQKNLWQRLGSANPSASINLALQALQLHAVWKRRVGDFVADGWLLSSSAWNGTSWISRPTSRRRRGHNRCKSMQPDRPGALPPILASIRPHPAGVKHLERETLLELCADWGEGSHGPRQTDLNSQAVPFFAGSLFSN